MSSSSLANELAAIGTQLSSVDIEITTFERSLQRAQDQKLKLEADQQRLLAAQRKEQAKLEAQRRREEAERQVQEAEEALKEAERQRQEAERQRQEADRKHLEALERQRLAAERRAELEARRSMSPPQTRAPPAASAAPAAGAPAPPASPKRRPTSPKRVAAGKGSGPPSPRGRKHKVPPLTPKSRAVKEARDAAALQKRIEELKNQIKEVEAAKTAKENIQAANAIVPVALPSAPRLDSTPKEATEPVALTEEEKQEKEEMKAQLQGMKEKNAWSKPSWTNSTAAPTLSRVPAEKPILVDSKAEAEQKHEWQKPGWMASREINGPSPTANPAWKPTKVVRSVPATAALKMEESKNEAIWSYKINKLPATPAPEPASQELISTSEEAEPESKPEMAADSTPEPSESEPTPQDEAAAAAMAPVSPTAVAPESPSAPHYADDAHDDVYKQQMDALRNRHKWSKPAWALPEEKTQTDESIITDSIQNDNLKKPQFGGYVRQVHPTDNMEIIKGQFVRPCAKTDPRLVWIVLNVNGDKWGKIVMHLHGKDVAGLVDQFLDLKGQDVTREQGQLMVHSSPVFCMTTVAAAACDVRAGVFGVIQEGHEVLHNVLAAPADAMVVVRQAHIYPVKRAKGS